MAFTDINSEERLVQKTFADHLRDQLGWNSGETLNDPDVWERHKRFIGAA